MYSYVIHPVKGTRISIHSSQGTELLINYASQLIRTPFKLNINTPSQILNGGAGIAGNINFLPLKILLDTVDSREDHYEEEHPRIMHTLNKFEELLKNTARANIILIGDSGGHGGGFFDLLEKLITQGYLARAILNTLVICTEGTSIRNEFGKYIDSIAPNKIYLDSKYNPYIYKLTNLEFFNIRCGVSNPVWSDMLIGSVRTFPNLLHIVCVGNAHTIPQREEQVSVKHYSSFYSDHPDDDSGYLNIMSLEETIEHKAPLINTETVFFRLTDEITDIADNVMFQIQDTIILQL